LRARRREKVPLEKYYLAWKGISYCGSGLCEKKMTA
jgi:hypothetical protein